jgi:hypothetical protein
MLFWVVLHNGAGTDRRGHTLETRSCHNEIKRSQCHHTTRLSTAVAPKIPANLPL